MCVRFDHRQSIVEHTLPTHPAQAASFSLCSEEIPFYKSRISRAHRTAVAMLDLFNSVLFLMSYLSYNYLLDVNYKKKSKKKERK